MARASIRVAQAQTAAEEAAIKRLYPEYIKMQFGTADQLSRNLDNQYSQFARQTILDEMGRDMGPSALENQMRELGANAMSYRPDQVSVPTNIREIFGVNAQRVGDVRAREVGAGALGQSLVGEAMNRVASGGRLSAEASRDAVQSARAGMAARGMATGNAGLAAELLNRDRYSRQRNMEDLSFAQNVQNADIQRQMAGAEMALQADRGNQALAGQMSLSDQAAQMDAQRLNQVRDTTLGQFLLNSQMANQEANMNQVNNNRGFLSSVSQQALANDQMRSQRRLGLGTLYGDMDPYRQALGPAFQLGMGTLGNTTQQVGNIYGNSLQQAGNTFSFNANMAASNRNAALNNNAAMQAAAMQAGASQNAGMMGMFGGIGGGIASGAGMAIAGASF
jgi:hypothetical protein